MGSDSKRLRAVTAIVAALLLVAFLMIHPAGAAHVTPADEKTAGVDRRPETVDAAVAWLSAKAPQMIRASRRTMRDGAAAFPPQVGTHYEAFWLRDYCYMLEGAIDAFSDRELTDACRLFVAAIGKDGAGVDCIRFNGKPIYKPGYGSMGLHPVADGSQFTVSVVWHTFRRTKDRELVRSVVGDLERTMVAVPRNPKTRLVHIKPGQPQERCPYGFTDSICKQGDELFCSLLFIQAARQMADLYGELDRPDDARRWSKEADDVAAQVCKVFWNPEWKMFRAATAKCNQPDVWGSAFAVSLGVADREQSLAVARYFRDHYDELVQRGQIRHLPRGMYWEGVGYRDAYQNGGYWATPVGWFVYTLDLVDPKLADRTVLDMTRDFRDRGVHEWVLGGRCAVPGYLASITLPLADIRRMLARRAEGSHDKP
jgi:hypothetical protein